MASTAPRRARIRAEPRDPRPMVAAAGVLTVLPVTGVPDPVRPGDDLAALAAGALAAPAVGLRPWDIVVVTHKVVSKAEGRLVDLGTVTPTRRARELAARVDNDARLVEVILSETARVVRAAPGVLICETRHGLVCANAGVDRSNVDGGESVTLLPADPDASAAHLHAAWLPLCAGGPLGVVVSDSFGRPFREAQVNVAVGVAGVPAVSDHRGLPDTAGLEMAASVLATADEIASAAELVMGKVEHVPIAVVRGLRWSGESRGAAELQRHPDQDVFRS